ncbi:MAG: AGE family epimerase/isomerase [Actinobacteria bacterium]|nr:MAG: AGE family epimerase/isomerase [Actinomycetota bacterium]
MSWLRSRSHRDWLASETTRLLEFARRARVEDGFGYLDADGAPDAGRARELWIATRMTHVFALGELLGHPGSRPLVDHGLAAIGAFADREHGGWFSEVDRDGPVRSVKEAYSHAFVLLAAASATVAGHDDGRSLLDDAISVVLERFWDEQDGASVDVWDRGWSQPEDYRGANANMHMLEAFLAVGDATGEPVWFARAEQIATRFIDEVARQHDWRVVEHFAGDWRPLPDYNADEPRHRFRPYGATPGHGLEWSRLLLQLRSALAASPGWLEDAAAALFLRAVADGWTPPGGLVYTTDFTGNAAVPDRLHWVIAEGIGAAAALSATTGGGQYEWWYRTFWDFADVHLRDRERGGWRHELDERLAPADRTWSGKPDAYHAVQATLLPRLPVAPSLAVALRDGLLA